MDADVRGALRLIRAGAMAGLDTQEIVELREACERELGIRTSTMSLADFLAKLPTRIRNLLLRIFAIDSDAVTDLLRETPADLIAENGFGPKTIETIRKTLVECGVVLHETYWNRREVAAAIREYEAERNSWRLPPEVEDLLEGPNAR